MTVLTLLCAAAALAAVPTGVLGARLSGDRWLAAVSVTLGVYGALVVASSTATPDGGATALDLAVHSTVVVLASLLLAAVLRAERRGRGRETAVILTGIGLLVLADVTSTALTGRPQAHGSLVLSGLHLAAVALVLGGSVALVRRSLVLWESAREAQEEELRLAEVRRTRSVERDHELRNGLAGLAGAARLLADERSDRDLLDTLVVSELHRLDGLLRSPDAAPAESAATTYAVEPVLRGLAALRSAAGTEIRLEIEPGLQAIGSSEALAQVVTNLVANTERHAPGSPVRITAAVRDDRVRIRVRDFGPGIAAGRETVVFEPGVRDRGRGGRGLGLHLCRRLMARDGGSIEIATPDPAAPGLAVTLGLRAPAPGTGADHTDLRRDSTVDTDDDIDTDTDDVAPSVAP